MSSTSAPIQFRGWCVCRRDGEGPLGLILIGTTTDLPGEVAQLAFSVSAPEDFPDALEDVRVEPLDERRHRIVSGSREWIVEGVAHMHREVAKAFYKALPPRAVPWQKRLFWRLVLKLAGSRLVQRLLFRKSASAAP